MSMFLPEGTGQTQPQDGVANVTPSNPETTTEDIALMQRVLSAASRNPNLIPSDFMAYVLDYIQTGRLQIPIGQVFGFEKFVSTQVSIFKDNGQSLSGTGNTTAPGPSVSAKAGKYVVIMGADMNTQFGNGVAQMVLTPGGLTVQGYQASVASVAKGTSISLAADGTISAQLQINGGGNLATISGAWLIAIRYDNP
jgi:hypothetical protein